MARHQVVAIDDPEDEPLWREVMARVTREAVPTAPASAAPIAAPRRPRLPRRRAAQPSPWTPAWVYDVDTLDRLTAEQAAWLQTLERSGRGNWYRWLCSFQAPATADQEPSFFRPQHLPAEVAEGSPGAESPHATLLKSAGWLEGVPADFSMEPEHVASIIRADPSWTVWRFAKPYLEHYYDEFDLGRLKRFIAALDRRPEGQPSPFRPSTVAHFFHRFLARTRLRQRYYLGDPALELASGLERWDRDDPPPADQLPVLAARGYQVDGRPLTIEMRAWPRGAAMLLLSTLLGIQERTLMSHLTKHRKNSRSTLPKT